MIRTWLAIMGVILLSAGAQAQDSPHDRLIAAEAAFDEGLAMQGENEALARLKFEESAAAYRAIQDEFGLGGADLLMNAGNASLLAGDVGRAIVAYRRALALDPTHRGATAGLAQARSRVNIAAPGEAKGGGWLTRAVAMVPRAWAVAVGIAAWVMGWVLVLTRIGHLRWRAPTWSIAGCFIAACALAGAVAVDVANSRDSRDAVVIAADVNGHDGPDARVYPRSFEQPLPAGVEGQVVDTRRGWVKFRLGDGVGGRETWVPASAVEMIRAGT